MISYDGMILGRIKMSKLNYGKCRNEGKPSHGKDRRKKRRLIKASPKQLKFLRNLKVNFSPNITMEQASKLIASERVKQGLDRSVKIYYPKHQGVTASMARDPEGDHLICIPAVKL